LEQKEGEIIIDKVLLLADDDKISVGAPYLDNVKVKAVIQGEKKDIRFYLINSAGVKNRAVFAAIARFTRL